MRLHDLQGQTFGRLTVLNRVPANNKRTYWRCLCTCGAKVTVLSELLTNERTKSCGCLRRELGIVLGSNSRRHGEARDGKTTSEYRMWGSMISRCCNPNHPAFHNYGGRGIRVCDRWRNSYEAFLADVGRRPAPNLSIDRIDNDGDYEPGNVRWATMTRQNRNKRRTVMATIGNVTKPLADWIDDAGIPRTTFYHRRRRGMSVRDALFTPTTNWPDSRQQPNSPVTQPAA